MKESAATTDELIARVNAGESTAWDDLVRRYTPLLWSVARSFRLSDPIPLVTLGVDLALIC